MPPFQIQSPEHARLSVPISIKLSPNKNNNQTIINFPYNHYPFPNHPLQADLFSTVVQCNINKEKIEKISNIKSQNLISLKKIVKLKNKNKKTQNLNSSKHAFPPYEFFYEKVQYSLKHILQTKFKQHQQWLSKSTLSKAEIKKTLAKLVAMLYKQGIILFLEFQHIGINKKGVIKVYVAPHVLFDDYQHNPKAKVLVVKSLDRIMKHIDAKYPKKMQIITNPQSLLKINDVSIEKYIAQTQQSIVIGYPILKNSIHQYNFQNSSKELLSKEEKSFIEDQDPFFVPSGSTNLDNFQMNQLFRKKFENQRLITNAQQHIKKQKRSTIILQMEQKNKIDQLTAQIQEIRKKLHQKCYQNTFKDQNSPRNLYASKGFKTMATQDKTEIKEALKEETNKLNQNDDKQNQIKENKRRKNTLSSINFYTGVVPDQRNINCINIYQTKDNQLPSYTGLGDDIMSVDTYELQIGDDYKMPNLVVSMGLRNSLSPKKQKEFSKIRVKFQQTEKQTPKTRVHESAGGKNYGYIINLIKPQFQPKKSNIYEQPEIENQQESKKSTSLKKSHSQSKKRFSFEKSQNQRKIDQELILKQQEQKPSRVIDQFQQDLKNLFGENRVTFSPMQTHKPSYQKRSTLSPTKLYQKNPQIQSIFLKNLQQKPKNKQKSSQVFKRNLAIQQKVKNAMQKTKKAIEILNKAKLRHNNFFI